MGDEFTSIDDIDPNAKVKIKAMQEPVAGPDVNNDCPIIRGTVEPHDAASYVKIYVALAAVGDAKVNQEDGSFVFEFTPNLLMDNNITVALVGSPVGVIPLDHRKQVLTQFTIKRTEPVPSLTGENTGAMRTVYQANPVPALMNWDVFEGKYSCCGALESYNIPKCLWNRCFCGICIPFAPIYAILGFFYGLMGDILGCVIFSLTLGYCQASNRYGEDSKAYSCDCRDDYVIDPRWDGAKWPQVCFTDNKLQHCLTYIMLCPLFIGPAIIVNSADCLCENE